MKNAKVIKDTNKQNLIEIDNFLYENTITLQKIVIMTVGNVLLSDDGIGPFIYRKLKASGLNHPSILLINAELNPENYFKTILEFEPSHVIIIDAIEANLQPGSIIFFQNNEIEDKLFSQPSTHMISLLNINSYLLEKNLNLLILNIGIQVKSTDFGVNVIDSNVKEIAMNLSEYLTRILFSLFNK